MDGGILKNKLSLLNSVVIFLIATFNLITCIQLQKDVFNILTEVVLIYGLAGITIYFGYKNWYKWTACLYLFIGLMATLIGVEDNGTGSIFLVFAIYIFNSKRFNIIIICSTIIAIVFKFTLLDYTISQSVNMLILYIYVFLIYYILIHPKKPNIYTGLDEITKEIIEYKMAGWSTKAVADKVCLSTDAIQKRISRACAKYDAGNLAQLVYKLMKKGYIST